MINPEREKRGPGKIVQLVIRQAVHVARPGGALDGMEHVCFVCADECTYPALYGLDDEGNVWECSLTSDGDGWHLFHQHDEVLK